MQTLEAIVEGSDGDIRQVYIYIWMYGCMDVCMYGWMHGCMCI